MSGLYGADQFYDQIIHAYENGMEGGLSTGYQELDALYTIGTGQITIITGIPGAGKSELLDQLMVNLASQHDWRFAVCSFENEPRIHIPKLMSKKLRKNFWTQQVSREELDDAFGWVRQHFSFLYHADGTLSSMDSILESLQVAVMRYGIRGWIIDPYNFILRA